MAKIELIDVAPKDLEPNDWNPNVLSDLKFDALKNSVKQFPEILEGQRVIVRHHPKDKDKYQILNGEHRWRIASELKFKTLPIGLIDEPEDSKAKLISLALANVGEEDYDKKLNVIFDIQKEMDLSVIANLIGEDKNTLTTYVDELHQDTKSLVETFEKYNSSDASTGLAEITEDYFDVLGVDPTEMAKTEVPSMLKLSVSGHIRKAIQKGFDSGFETAYGVIQEACKLFVEKEETKK